ncbi:UNVERIFIED_CONTAM: hypothetical protein FKN15_052083 [Acipenser sinensis]
MSQFMEVMMGQQSILMSLANVVPRVPEQPTGPIASQPLAPPQPAPVVSPPVQSQGAWDIDAVSRYTSDVLEGESIETEVASQHSEQDIELEVLDTDDPTWSVVERATHHLGIEWPMAELPRRSLFESPSAQPHQSRMLPAFPDFIKEVQSTWGAPASAPVTSRKASAFSMQGASEAGLASFPPVDAAFAVLVKTPTLSGLTKDPACPNKQCRTTEVHLKKGYAAATEAVRLSNVASLLTVYQAALIKDLPECPSVALRSELGTVSQLLVKLAQLNVRAQGRSIASLVVARRQLWLSQASVQEPDKAPLLDAPITPGHTFGPAFTRWRPLGNCPGCPFGNPAMPIPIETLGSVVLHSLGTLVFRHPWCLEDSSPQHSALHPAHAIPFFGASLIYSLDASAGGNCLHRTMPLLPWQTCPISAGSKEKTMQSRISHFSN